VKRNHGPALGVIQAIRKHAEDIRWPPLLFPSLESLLDVLNLCLERTPINEQADIGEHLRISRWPAFCQKEFRQRAPENRLVARGQGQG
jgi:hypothetical protein